MDLYYEVHGKGKPVILLHSGGADLRDWKYLVPLLSKHYQVIAFDGRGAGKSPSPITPPNYVEDLLNLLNYFGLEKVAMIGHSIGGQVATDFALEYPDKVSELVLIAPGLSGFDLSEEFKEWMQKINEVFPDEDRVMELAFDAPSYQIVMSGPHRDLMLDMFRHHLQKTSEWKTFESIWPQPPANDRLDQLKVKTLYLIGDHEIPDNIRIKEQFRQQVPDIRIATIQGADHMPTLTHPHALYEHITRFLED